MDKQEREKLEKLNYSFDVEQEKVSHPENSEHESYYRVTVSHNGVVIGTRSEIKKDRALERALSLARLHNSSPAKAEEKSAESEGGRWINT